MCTGSVFCYPINSNCLARLKFVHPIFKLCTPRSYFLSCLSTADLRFYQQWPTYTKTYVSSKNCCTAEPDPSLYLTSLLSRTYHIVGWETAETWTDKHLTAGAECAEYGRWRWLGKRKFWQPAPLVGVVGKLPSFFCTQLSWLCPLVVHQHGTSTQGQSRSVKISEHPDCGSHTSTRQSVEKYYNASDKKKCFFGGLWQFGVPVRDNLCMLMCRCTFTE